MKNKQLCNFIENVYQIEDNLERLKSVYRQNNMLQDLQLINELQHNFQNSMADYIDILCSKN